MKIIYKQMAQAFYEALLASSAKDQSKVVARFAEMICERRLGGALDEIIEAFIRVVRLEQKQRDVTVRVARDVVSSDEVLKLLPQGYDYAVSTQVDPELLGGAVVRMDDVLIDASVKRKLERLHEGMTGLNTNV